MIILKFVSNLVLTLSLILSVLLLIPLVPFFDQWYQLAVVRSASMEPSLSVGSLAIYQVQAHYNPGEIIAYEVGDGEETKLIIHRIVKKQTQSERVTFLTQGDATQYLSAQPVFSSQVKGKLVGSIPQAGYVLGWFKSKTGIAVTLFVPLATLVIYELTKLP